MNTTTINLALAFNQNYVRHFFALITSIFVNNRNHNFIVHCIVADLSETDKDLISTFAEENNSEVRFYEISQPFVEKFLFGSSWSPANYYRLFFSLLALVDVEKLLYLDTDIIVVNDLAPLYNTPLDEYAVAAVYDDYVKNAPQLGIPEEGNYFNSGMMLINMPVWKKDKVAEHVFAYLAKYPERINYADQCALNAVLMNRWKKLDWRYNVLHSRIPDAMSRSEKKQFLADKVVIHYTMDRPWKMLCRNPYRDLYHKYLDLSPFKFTNRYVDYSIQKVPRFLKIRVAEWYFNMPVLKVLWRRFKGLKTYLSKGQSAHLR